jgi:mRNA (2'-O-methyladenosine-N6-)-methyltransferase
MRSAAQPKWTMACAARRAMRQGCQLVHFRALIGPHTDLKLGDCSYLDACRY